ncbi:MULTISPECIES: (Fe-S)-binding protein [unclassified Methanothermobacter]|uniref:(Fe-S)-binding protein n=1 Tax=unclassified Methanothermobacter TaxID=2631116 RepID=UPI0011C9A315|nr:MULTISPECIES: (Fe-S)-binding protein [unclassified Methanothermobacter]QEF93968.1 (Fe-S)-binding protein [Methanothermobacter sp. KEPCO-1]QHN08604.1 (Fe-S)-binding protein [Methanothermobacter sp. THM-2]
MVIYFRGCLARERLTAIEESTEKILQVAGIEYRVMDDETCCGSVLLRTGFLKEAERQINRTGKMLQGREVIVSCAGCYRTLNEDYRRRGYSIGVKHISQVILDLVNSGNIEFDKTVLRVTYHDPCHLSRHTDEKDATREILKVFTDFREMEHHGRDSRCCGAGGGLRSAHRDISARVASSRIDEAERTGADILCTSCPFCRMNLESTSMRVMDITELLSEIIREDKG